MRTRIVQDGTLRYRFFLQLKRLPAERKVEGNHGRTGPAKFCRTKNLETAVEDAEIGDIMNEINDLRSELAGASDPRPATSHLKSVPSPAESEGSVPDVDDLGGPTADEDAADTDDAMSGASLLDMAIEADAETEAEDSVPEPGPTVVKASDPGGSLSLSLAGSTSLKLKYEYEGQEILIGFADQCLKVTLSDGTEFKIPLARGRQR